MLMHLGRRSNGKMSSGDRLPLARSNDIVVEETGEEVLVFDRLSNRAHCLSPTAARVWRACDGQGTTVALADELGSDAVSRALEELHGCELLETPPHVHAGNGFTRREVAIRTAKYGTAAAAVPLIFSVAAPLPAAAVTPTPAICAEYNAQGCGACDQIRGCCCCCQNPGSCKLCYPSAQCPSFTCADNALGHCSTNNGTIEPGTVECENLPNLNQNLRNSCGCSYPSTGGGG
jgi:hypothetical protein